ncbi:hypothetical protein [Photorhabdus luminescens]|nr:hypothetical protein [Photorhabdus luminescens]
MDSDISEQAVNRAVNKRIPTSTVAINKCIHWTAHFPIKVIF